MSVASMGQLYVAFHDVVDREPPKDGVCPHARLAVMAEIVAPSVQMAYAEMYDSECEEKTPEERAIQLFESFMSMALETWWKEQIIFTDSAVERHAPLFRCLPENEPSYPSGAAAL